MNFAAVFIRRPVLATVLSLLILLLGLQGLSTLNIRQYPKVEETVISVSTAYPGASPDLIQSFITTPLARAVSSAENVDYISSTSTLSSSNISVRMRLGTNPDSALTEIISKVQQARFELPTDAQDPVIVKGTGFQFPIMFISFVSDRMNPRQITEYVRQVIQPQLATVPGIADASVRGGESYAMRVWLDPLRLSSRGVTAAEVVAALRAGNFLASPGKTENDLSASVIQAETTIKQPEEFGALPVRGSGNDVVRIRDVADVELGAIDDNIRVIAEDGKAGTFVGLFPTPSANPIDISANIRKMLPELQLPPGMKVSISLDSSIAINSSIKEVYTTIAEAVVIVILVIFIFLGNVRSTLIPIVTIPLSLIGVMFVLYVLGYSINLLTLLALILAIGLVVDDAIVVVENVHRHIEMGKRPMAAAIDAMGELMRPLIAMTFTLAAVYAPIGFTQGLTGALFREFAFALAGAVVLSGIIALTLSPMMSSRLLKKSEGEGRAHRFEKWIDHNFERLAVNYGRFLHTVVDMRGVVAGLVVIILATSAYLYVNTRSELVPAEDQGLVGSLLEGPRYATPDYMQAFGERLEKEVGPIPETASHFKIIGWRGDNTIFTAWGLKPWSERKRPQSAIMQQVQQGEARMPGFVGQVFSPNFLPGAGGGFGTQYVIRSTRSPAEVFEVAEAVKEKAMQSGQFFLVMNSINFSMPQARVLIDRERAAALGVTVADIATTLNILLSNSYVTRFDRDNRAYEVIPRAHDVDRANPASMGRFYLRSANGGMVPLSAVTTIKTEASPSAIEQFNQLNSATLTAVGFAKGADAIRILRDAGKAVMPDGFFEDFAGEARLTLQEGETLILAFGLAVLFIYLVLAAQFESFRDPLIIMMAVPLSIFGALIPLSFGLSTLNIYSQVGLITLVGLITKHGILIVNFANERRAQGMSRREAVEDAARVRLRPILMTTAAMVVSVVPLLIAAGAGAAARFSIGIVIFSGMAIGSFFTLFVVPVFYTYIARSDASYAAWAGLRPSPAE